MNRNKKNYRKLEKKRNFLNKIKASLKKKKNYVILKDRKLFSKIKNKTRMPTFTTAIQYCTEISSQSNHSRKGNFKNIHI